MAKSEILDAYKKVCADVLPNDPRGFYTTRFLKDHVLKIASFSPSSVLPNDHCYNWTNVGAKGKRPVFLRIGTERQAEGFIYRGPDFEYDGPIGHRPNQGLHAGKLVQVESRTSLIPVAYSDELDFSSSVVLKKVERARREIDVILRRSFLANQCKQDADYECRLCNTVLTLSCGGRYAEAHHIRPLGEPHNGPDKIENMVCLCANCHILADYFAISFNISEWPEQSHEYVKYHNSMVN